MKTEIAMETFILRAGSVTLPRGGTFNLDKQLTGEIGVRSRRNRAKKVGRKEEQWQQSTNHAQKEIEKEVLRKQKTDKRGKKQNFSEKPCHRLFPVAALKLIDEEVFHLVS